MSNILQIGYTTEGTTDIRFLENIIRKSFERIVLECNFEIEVYQPEYLRKEGNDFVSQICNLAKKYSYFHVICVHRDSDSPTIENVMKNSIIPAFEAVNEIEQDVCDNLIAIIPVQMTEAWMMANVNLLKERIGTDKSNNELGLPIRVNAIEGIQDPKNVIIEAIRIAQTDQSKRRKKLTIAQLYSPISQELLVENLEELPSYRAFLDNIRDSLRRLNYLLR